MLLLTETLAIKEFPKTNIRLYIEVYFYKCAVV